MVGKRAATPGAANDVLKKIKILMHFAVDNGWRRDDPTVRIKSFAEGEFHTWTDDEIAPLSGAGQPVPARERPLLFCSTPARGFRMCREWLGRMLRPMPSASFRAKRKPNFGFRCIRSFAV